MAPAHFASQDPSTNKVDTRCIPCSSFPQPDALIYQCARTHAQLPTSHPLRTTVACGGKPGGQVKWRSKRSPARTLGLPAPTRAPELRCAAKRNQNNTPRSPEHLPQISCPILISPLSLPSRIQFIERRHHAASPPTKPEDTETRECMLPIHRDATCHAPLLEPGGCGCSPGCRR